MQERPPKRQKQTTTKKQGSKLTTEMREILTKGYMLTDEHIQLAQELLQTEFPELDGFQSTLLSQIDGFCPVRDEAIQIHHVAGNHWVASSSIGQTVTIFDSKFGGGELSSSLTHQLATVYRTLVKTSDEDGDEMDPILEVNIPYVQQQQGKRDCGLFAIAFALHAAMGDDIKKITFDQPKMRCHLLECFEKKKLTRFPLAEQKTAKKWNYLHYCTYGDMVQCDECEKWFHLKCVGLEELTTEENWSCNSCM